MNSFFLYSNFMEYVIRDRKFNVIIIILELLPLYVAIENLFPTFANANYFAPLYFFSFPSIIEVMNIYFMVNENLTDCSLLYGYNFIFSSSSENRSRVGVVSELNYQLIYFKFIILGLLILGICVLSFHDAFKCNNVIKKVFFTFLSNFIYFSFRLMTTNFYIIATSVPLKFIFNLNYLSKVKKQDYINLSISIIMLVIIFILDFVKRIYSNNKNFLLEFPNYEIENSGHYIEMALMIMVSLEFNLRGKDNEIYVLIKLSTCFLLFISSLNFYFCFRKNPKNNFIKVNLLVKIFMFVFLFVRFLMLLTFETNLFNSHILMLCVLLCIAFLLSYHIDYVEKNKIVCLNNIHDLIYFCSILYKNYKINKKESTILREISFSIQKLIKVTLLNHKKLCFEADCIFCTFIWNRENLDNLDFENFIEFLHDNLNSLKTNKNNSDFYILKGILITLSDKRKAFRICFFLNKVISKVRDQRSTLSLKYFNCHIYSQDQENNSNEFKSIYFYEKVRDNLHESLNLINKTLHSVEYDKNNNNADKVVFNSAKLYKLYEDTKNVLIKLNTFYGRELIFKNFFLMFIQCFYLIFNGHLPGFDREEILSHELIDNMEKAINEDDKIITIYDFQKRTIVIKSVPKSILKELRVESSLIHKDFSQLFPTKLEKYIHQSIEFNLVEQKKRTFELNMFFLNSEGFIIGLKSITHTIPTLYDTFFIIFKINLNSIKRNVLLFNSHGRIVSNSKLFCEIVDNDINFVKKNISISSLRIQEEDLSNPFPDLFKACINLKYIKNTQDNVIPSERLHLSPLHSSTINKVYLTLKKICQYNNCIDAVVAYEFFSENFQKAHKIQNVLTNEIFDLENLELERIEHGSTSITNNSLNQSVSVAFSFYNSIITHKKDADNQTKNNKSQKMINIGIFLNIVITVFSITLIGIINLKSKYLINLGDTFKNQILYELNWNYNYLYITFFDNFSLELSEPLTLKNVFPQADFSQIKYKNIINILDAEFKLRGIKVIDLYKQTLNSINTNIDPIFIEDKLNTRCQIILISSSNHTSIESIPTFDLLNNFGLYFQNINPDKKMKVILKNSQLIRIDTKDQKLISEAEKSFFIMIQNSNNFLAALNNIGTEIYNLLNIHIQEFRNLVYYAFITMIVIYLGSFVLSILHLIYIQVILTYKFNEINCYTDHKIDQIKKKMEIVKDLLCFSTNPAKTFNKYLKLVKSNKSSPSETLSSKLITSIQKKDRNQIKKAENITKIIILDRLSNIFAKLVFIAFIFIIYSIFVLKYISKLHTDCLKTAEYFYVTSNKLSYNYYYFGFSRYVIITNQTTTFHGLNQNLINIQDKFYEFSNKLKRLESTYSILEPILNYKKSLKGEKLCPILWTNYSDPIFDQLSQRDYIYPTLLYLCSQTPIMGSNIDSIFVNSIYKGRLFIEEFASLYRSFENIDKLWSSPEMIEMIYINALYLRPYYQNLVETYVFSVYQKSFESFISFSLLIFFLNLVIELMTFFVFSLRMNRVCSNHIEEIDLLLNIIKI
jgi:hypothetical protein